MKQKKKIPKCGELAYILGLIVLPFGTMLITKADFGVSVVVAPAYICSLRFDFLTFGRAEYIIQGILLLIFCLIMRSGKWQWLLSFVTAFLYGKSLDLFFLLFGFFIPANLPIRIVCFIVGNVIATLGIALFLEACFPPEVYELFVKGVSEKFKLPFAGTKIGYDLSSLILSLGLSFLFFHALKGIGIGTAVSALLNGFLINLWRKGLNQICDFDCRLPVLEKVFPHTEE